MPVGSSQQKAWISFAIALLWTRPPSAIRRSGHWQHLEATRGGFLQAETKLHLARFPGCVREHMIRPEAPCAFSCTRRPQPVCRCKVDGNFVCMAGNHSAEQLESATPRAPLRWLMWARCQGRPRLDRPSFYAGFPGSKHGMLQLLS